MCILRVDTLRLLDSSGEICLIAIQEKWGGHLLLSLQTKLVILSKWVPIFIPHTLDPRDSILIIQQNTFLEIGCTCMDYNRRLLFQIILFYMVRVWCTYHNTCFLFYLNFAEKNDDVSLRCGGWRYSDLVVRWLHGPLGLIK